MAQTDAEYIQVIRDWWVHEGWYVTKAEKDILLDLLGEAEKDAREITKAYTATRVELDEAVGLLVRIALPLAVLRGALETLYTFPRVRNLLAPKESLGSVAAQVESALSSTPSDSLERLGKLEAVAEAARNMDIHISEGKEGLSFSFKAGIKELADALSALDAICERPIPKSLTLTPLGVE